MLSQLTLTGMNNYGEMINDDLFSDLVLPEVLDKDVVVNAILTTCSSLPVVYPDYSFLKNQIKYWSKRKKPIFDKWVWLLSQEYNPLYNYDRTEEFSDSEVVANSGTKSDNTSTSFNSSNVSNNTVTNKATSYESDTFKDTSQNIGSDSITGSNSGSTNTSSRENSDTNRILTHKARLFGNIGITTSTQMLSESWDWYNKDIPMIIAEEFKCDFCLGIYN